MVASEGSLYDPSGRSTPGQLTLSFIHTEIDWAERRDSVHPWCVEELEAEAYGRLVTCEVCHKPYNPQEMKELADRFKDDVYRPGEDVSHLEDLSDDEKSERRREIEAIFADPERFREEQMEQYRAADKEANE